MSATQQTATQETDFDVIISGFGPTGAVTAAQLGRRGHRTLVIDRWPEVYAKPRAIAMDHEILRIFDNLGVADEVAPHVAPFTASEHFGADGQLLRRIDMVEKPYPLGYTPSMVFTQPPVEAILRRHVESLDSVQVDLGTELIGIAQDDECVSVELRASDGATRTATARYLIGCDGATSTVRQAVGIALEDLIFDEPWLVIDVKVNEDSLHKLPQNSAQFCEPSRPTSFIMGPDNHRRWEIMLLPGENPEQMVEDAAVWRLLSRWLTPEDGTLWRAAAYRFHALVADNWRRGRVLVAGDAAHQQPPFIGQGMCQGLRDATNIAWKLDRVLNGQSPEALLDSYGIERKAHVRELTGKIKDIGETICIRDPEAARERDARILAEGGGQARTVTRQEIVPPLRTGLIDTDSPAAGTLFPQPKVRVDDSSTLLDKTIGDGWRLIFAAKALSLADVENAAEGLGKDAIAIRGIVSTADAASPDALEEQDDVMANWFAQHGVAAALVRPDHYVFATAADVPSLETKISELAARLGETGHS